MCVFTHSYLEKGVCMSASAFCWTLKSGDDSSHVGWKKYVVLYWLQWFCLQFMGVVIIKALYQPDISAVLYCECSPAGSTQSSFLLFGGSLTRAWVGTMPQLSQKPSGEFSTCLPQWSVNVGSFAPFVYTRLPPLPPSNNKQGHF